MAKYRKASEKTISRGKGKSTDQLSLADAKEYFNSRAKETGAKRFRWNGDVYDLNGNKISEPVRSSGGSSRASAKDEGPKRPKANPSRGPGGARPEPGKAGGLPAAKGKESPGKRGEVNPAVVGAMGAAAVGAGVAAARSGRGGARTTGGGSAQTGRNALPKPEARLALPAPNRGGTIIPENTKPKALPKPEAKPKTEVKSGRGRGAGGLGTGVRVVGGSPGSRISRGGRVLQMPDVMSYQFMNKGGVVKKKK